MKAPTIVLLTALVVGSPSWAGAAELPLEAQSVRAPNPMFLPGPPLWRPPVERPRVMLKTTSFEDVVDQCVTARQHQCDRLGITARFARCGNSVLHAPVPFDQSLFETEDTVGGWGETPLTAFLHVHPLIVQIEAKRVRVAACLLQRISPRQAEPHPRRPL